MARPLLLVATFAEQKLAKAVEKYRKSAPELSAWIEANLPEGFTVFLLPEPVRKRLRTSNLMENLNHQIRRRTRVASIFRTPKAVYGSSPPSSWNLR